MVKLDQEETEILEAFEAGELQRSADADEVLKRHQEYAAATLRRDARVNVRLNNRYLSRLKKNAPWNRVSPTKYWHQVFSTSVWRARCARAARPRPTGASKQVVA